MTNIFQTHQSATFFKEFVIAVFGNMEICAVLSECFQKTKWNMKKSNFFTQFLKNGVELASWQDLVHNLSKKRHGMWNSWQVFFHSLSEKRYGIRNSWQVFFHSVSNDGVEYGIVGKFSFIVFLKNGMEYGIVGKFSYIEFLITLWNMEYLAGFLS
jgi:hypothetical protein